MTVGIEAGILHPQGGRGLGWVPGWFQDPSAGEGGGEGAGRAPGGWYQQTRAPGPGEKLVPPAGTQAAPYSRLSAERVSVNQTAPRWGCLGQRLLLRVHRRFCSWCCPW